MTTLHDNVGIASYVHASLRLDPTDSVVLVLCTNGMALGTLRIDAHPETEASEFASSVVRILTSISEPIDATILVSYEGDKAMTFAQYDELSQRLDAMGAPIAKAVLVTNGQIMDYDGDSTDAVDYAEVYTNPFTLEAMLATGPTRLAEDAPQCAEATEATEEAKADRITELAGEDYLSLADRGLIAFARQLGHDMMHQIARYLDQGKVTEDMAGWIAGTYALRMGRDTATAALAGTPGTEQELAELLMGDTMIADRKIFDAGAAMLYEALEFLAGDDRPNVLAALGWTRWMAGQGTEAMKFLDQALAIDPEHRLSHLQQRLFTSGKLPKSASTPDK